MGCLKKGFLLCLAVTFSLPVLATEYEKVELTRVDHDLYKTKKGTYIATRSCYKTAHGDKGVLAYNKYSSYGNKVIFSDDSKCDVKQIIK